MFRGCVIVSFAIALMFRDCVNRFPQVVLLRSDVDACGDCFSIALCLSLSCTIVVLGECRALWGECERVHVHN